MSAQGVDDGKILNSRVEVNIAEHCNLSCRSCSHLSPAMPRKYVDAAALRRDLEALAAVYHARSVRLLGGEPLLHPDLLEVIEAAANSGVADEVAVITNGVLLPRMPAAFWRAVDEVYVSSYPGFELSEADIGRTVELAAEYDVNYSINLVTVFRESHSNMGTSEAALVQRIYDTCEVMHVGHCHTVADGYLFKCPQSYFLPKKLAAMAREDPLADAIAISPGPSFGEDLRAFLEDNRPLAACRYCLGTVGQRFPQEQVPRQDWSRAQEHTSEELLDMDLLIAAEAVMRA